MLKFAKNWGGPVIGLTATPLTEGLGNWYSHVVNAVTTDQLLHDGYLAPLKIFAATEIDMAGAKKGSDGEWLRSEVRTRGRPIIGDIVSTWERSTRQHFGGPVKTLLFSADVAHGEELCRAFQAAGHDFRQSTYRDGIDETEAMVEGFRRGEFTGLVSVEKFVKGFDVPREVQKSPDAIQPVCGRTPRCQSCHRWLESGSRLGSPKRPQRRLMGRSPGASETQT